jgi:hypothetical protein
MTLAEIIKLSIFIVIGSGIGTIIAQELFKHRLNKEFFRYSKLYSDKLDIIRVLYKKLVMMEKAHEKFMRQNEPSDAIEKTRFEEETNEIMNDFVDFYEENEIVFDDSTVAIMSQILEMIKESKKSQNMVNVFNDARGSEAWVKAISVKQDLYERFVYQELPKLKNKLKKDFQKRYKLLSK